MKHNGKSIMKKCGVPDEWLKNGIKR